jgi:retron-type reverse transcriptase
VKKAQIPAEYESKLTENLKSLLTRFKTGKYYASPVKREYIPKGVKGKEMRPLGIPTLEDKILQRAVLMVLEPLYELEYYDCSYGFRPERSVHQALKELWQTVTLMGGCTILEVDIRNFFGTLRHNDLRDFIKQRVCDGVWLNRRNRNNEMNWDVFNKLLKKYPLPRPRIVHSFA